MACQGFRQNRLRSEGFSLAADRRPVLRVVSICDELVAPGMAPAKAKSATGCSRSLKARASNDRPRGEPPSAALSGDRCAHAPPSQSTGAAAAVRYYAQIDRKVVNPKLSLRSSYPNAPQVLALIAWRICSRHMSCAGHEESDDGCPVRDRYASEGSARER